MAKKREAMRILSHAVGSGKLLKGTEDDRSTDFRTPDFFEYHPRQRLNQINGLQTETRSADENSAEIRSVLTNEVSAKERRITRAAACRRTRSKATRPRSAYRE